MPHKGVLKPYSAIFVSQIVTFMEKEQNLLLECHRQFSETESARILTLYRSRDNRLTFDERLSITKEIEKIFYPVYLELRSINPSLTDWDLMLSVLSYEGFSVSVIAECFSVSNDAVRMRKSRLREKLPQEWFSLIFHTVTKMYQDQCHDCVTEKVSGPDDAAIPLAAQTQNKNVMEQNKPIKMTFGKAIINGLCGSVRFKGRASRAEFWYYTLFCFIMQIAVFSLMLWLTSVNSIIPYQYDHIVTRAWVVIAALLAISHSAASVRRIQDTDRNGWLWVTTYLTPWIVFIVMFIWRIEYDVYLRNLEQSQLPDRFVMNWANAMYVIDILILIATITVNTVWYCRKGTEGPNNYGPDPLFQTNGLKS